MAALLSIIKKVEVAGGDVSFFFEGSEEPWSVSEFETMSPTRLALENIEYYVLRFNDGKR